MRKHAIMKTGILLLGVIWMAIPVLGGTVHLVGGGVHYENGSAPASVQFSAYLLSSTGQILTGQILTQDSAGCGYEDGYYWIQCSGFSSWHAGDLLHVDITDSEGRTAFARVELTYESLDRFDIIISFSNFTISVLTIPYGLDFTVDGAHYSSPHTFNWKEGTTYQISIDSPQNDPTSSNVRYVFKNWDKSASRTFTYTANSSDILTAFFTDQYTLQTLTNPVDGGHIELSPEKDWYDEGDTVTVRAIADAAQNLAFSSWDGSLESTHAVETLIMDGPKIITANYAVPTYHLTVLIDPPGSGTVDQYPLKSVYLQNETVFLYPNPAENYMFVSWSGDTVSSEKLVGIPMTSDKEVTARFASYDPGVRVTIRTSPPGLPCLVDDNIYTTPHTFLWPRESEHLITVDSLIQLSQEARQVFLSWNHTSVSQFGWTASADTNLTANFLSQFQVTALAVPELGGTVQVTPEKEWYDLGDEIEVTASPNFGGGYVFSHWSGDLSGYDNPVSAQVDSGLQISADFMHDHYSLATHVSPEGSGTIQRIPDQGSYAKGDTLFLYAIPDSGYVFSRWSGSSTAVTEIIQVIMNTHKDVTAHFVEETSSINKKDEGAIPQTLMLSPNYPNPFNSSTKFNVSLPDEMPASIGVYDIHGRLVRELYHGRMKGNHVLTWEGTDNAGQSCQSGIYFIYLRQAHNKKVQRILLLK